MDAHNQVASIVVEGSLCMDMYDEHPGLAYFYRTIRRCLPIPHALPLATAKLIAQRDWARRKHESEADEDPWAEYDGQFTASRILLLAHDGTVLQCYEDERWVTDFVAPAEWDALLTHAADLESEAAIEAGWDNFSTADSLRSSATAIRRRVSMARANAAAQESKDDSIRGLSARVLAALARVATTAGDPAAVDAWTAAKRAARALGIREQLASVQEPPLMFEGEAWLIAAWREGQAWAQELEEGFVDED
ncbi:hypothetical protein DIE18_03640 [Burkholderia sp. Bp9125]|nr:hypothetical protein DIE18_03640 [Burkholderia sp. Bp9125]